ncbi:MAG: DUF1854 domain-containing protein [Oscillospiraceae bacterium]|nr:DUF1854 domain-containing protein [Oscillospiraceae bacterium]
MADTVTGGEAAEAAVGSEAEVGSEAAAKGAPAKETLVDITTIRYLDPVSTAFKETEGGFVSMEAGPDESYPRVNFQRSFPFSRSGEFISVRTVEGKEIGIIKKLSLFASEAVAMVGRQLDRRYFSPTVTKINSIKEEFGYNYFDVESSAGQCRFTVRGGHNVVSITETRVLLLDVDGNRFEIPDINKLDDRSLKRLEMFL